MRMPFSLLRMISPTVRNVFVVVTSFCLTAGVIANAFHQRKQFYPSIVYITKSNASMAAVYFQGLVFMYLAWKVIRWIFFGQLRPTEVEHLMERGWYAITETCLAFTVFREDFSAAFVALFCLLLFLKCFHWLAEDRIDFMERTPVISKLFHVRAVGLLTFLSFCDTFFVIYAYNSLVTKGVTFQLVFGFEYAVLTTSVFFITVKYILHCIDSFNDHTPWDQKAAILLYMELFVNLTKVCLYAAFLSLMLRVHSVPLFTIRPIYMSFRALKKALYDVIMSRRAIHTMNTLFPNVTLEEIRSGDTTCIICRDEMTTGCKRLPCGHIFHTHCLRSWFQRQQSCPTCRLDIFRPQHQRQTGPPGPAQQQQPPAGPNMQQIPNGFFMPPNMFPPPPFPGGGVPFGGFNFGPFNNFIPPFPPQPNAAGQAPPAAQPANTDGAPNQSAQSTSSTTAPPNMPPPPVFPPGVAPPFFPAFAPFIPFPAPPVPVPDFSTLSETELNRMEENNRRAIELRIAHLRNIQALLDAAVIQFTQYISLMPVMTPSAPPTTSARESQTSTSAQSSSSSQTDGTSQRDSEQVGTSSVSNSENSSNNNESINNEADEIRRRRLGRFSNLE